MKEQTKLRRSISLPSLMLYGVGTIVGGGIYALLGEVTGRAGLFAPIALTLSGLLALLSAASFAELSSRFPVSAGEARYVYAGFGRRNLATMTGWGVILTGIVSAATLSVATIRFLQDFVTVPEYVGIPLLVLGMGAVAAWGIGGSVSVVVAITIVEVAALIYVIVLAGDSLGQLPERWHELVPPLSGGSGEMAGAWTGIFSGAFLAFYAFIGFEDMVNMAEEVRDVRRVLPVAILVAVVLSTLLYVTVSVVAVLTVPAAQLAASNTPVAEIVADRGRYSSAGLRIVSLLTGLNGALVQIIMASRVAYGMADQGQAPRWLGIVNARTRTPIRATALMTTAVLLLGLFFPLATLAQATSTIILVIFASVNLALWRIKKIDPAPPDVGVRLPRPIPMIGALACVSVLLFRLWVEFLAG